MKKKRISQAHRDALKFFRCPRDGGQIVDVTYAVDEDGLYERSYDRSDRTETITFREYSSRATEAQLAFAPQNGRLPRCRRTWYVVEVR